MIASCAHVHLIISKIGKDNNGIGWGTANYHPGKVAGDLTDAGDIAIMLLKYLSTDYTYNFDGFADYWYNEITINGYGSCNFQVNTWKYLIILNVNLISFSFSFKYFVVGRSGCCQLSTRTEAWLHKWWIS